MGHPFYHTASNTLITIIDVFKEKKIYKKKDRHIIFLCGGPVKRNSRSLRAKFYKYAKTNLKQFRIFIAEDATKDLSKDEAPEFSNIADFETFLANFADCILIFPESAGSIAELSYFSSIDNIASKMLVVNDSNEQDDSFINLGPIDKIEEKSRFKPKILTNFKSPEFNTIKTKLQKRLPISQAKRFHFNSFSDLEHKDRLYVIFQLIFIFKVLTLDGIFYCITKIFNGSVDRREIKHILSFLIAAKYLKRVKEDSEYFTTFKKNGTFLEFRNYNILNLQLRAVDYFRGYHQESYDLLKEI